MRGELGRQPDLADVVSLDDARASRQDAGGDGGGGVGRGGELSRRARRPTFTPAELLDGDWRASAGDEAFAGSVHHALRRLAAIEAQLDLALGRGLARLHAGNGHRALGHSRQVDCVPARYGFSWSHARELMALAEGLERLPSCRRAFLAALVPRSKARLLVRVATPETEAKWLVLARRLGLRAFESAVKHHRAAGTMTDAAAGACTSGAPPNEDDSDLVRVRWRTSLLDAAAWNGCCREMLRVVVGQQGPDWVLAEALAADSLARWGWGDDFEPPQPASLGAASDGVRARRARSGRAPSRRDVRALTRRLAALRAAAPSLELPDLDACADAWALHGALAHLVALRHGLGYERSRLLWLAREHALHRALGLRSAAEHQDALSLSPRDVAHDLALQERLLDLPRCAGAWREGMLPARTVALVAKVASRATEAAWVEWASRATSKRLQLEVEWHLALRAASPEYLSRTQGLPRPEFATESFLLDWQAFFGVGRAPRTHEEIAGAGGACTSAQAPATARDALRERCHAVVSFPAPPDAAAVIRHAVERARELFGRHLDDGECVQLMVEQLAEDVRDPRVAGRRRWHRVLDRAGWLCQSPHCRARVAFEVHHRRYRSHGGGHERGNLVALCVGCHRLVHEGKLSILGRAPCDLWFRVHDGRGAIREVYVRGAVRRAA